MANRPRWFPDWSLDIAAVIASGPSASSSGIERLRGCARVVTVNSSWRLAPWCDVVYACDNDWWAMYQDEVARKCMGMRVAVRRDGIERLTDANLVDVPSTNAKTRASRAWMLMDPPGMIGTGGNSGFQALNLTAQFGARKILLVGFDMNLDAGSHWHGDHATGLRNPTVDLMAKWRRVLDAQANTLREYGIDVVNVSPISALTEFRKATIEEALEQWNTQTMSPRSMHAAE